MNSRTEFKRLVEGNLIPFALAVLVFIHMYLIYFHPNWNLPFPRSLYCYLELLFFAFATYFVTSRIKSSKGKISIRSLAVLILGISFACFALTQTASFQNFIFPSFLELCKLIYREGLQMMLFCALGGICGTLLIAHLLVNAASLIIDMVSRGNDG